VFFSLISIYERLVFFISLEITHATIEITRHDHSIIAFSHHIYACCCSSRTSRSWWITQSAQHHRRGCNII